MMGGGVRGRRDQGQALPLPWGGGDRASEGLHLHSLAAPSTSPSQQPLIWFDVSFSIFFFLQTGRLLSLGGGLLTAQLLSG